MEMVRMLLNQVFLERRNLPQTAQQLKAMKNEQQALQDLTASLFEGLPEPKVNYLKDMDPYDPRRARRQLAPGSPLPPPTPGLPDFLMKRASKKNVKKPDNVKKA